MDKVYEKYDKEMEKVNKQSSPLPLIPISNHRETRLSTQDHYSYQNNLNQDVHYNQSQNYRQSNTPDLSGYYESIYNRTSRPKATYHENRIGNDLRPSMLIPRNTPSTNRSVSTITRDPVLAGQRINNMLALANDKAQKINFMISDQEKLAMKQMKNIAHDTRRRLSLAASNLNNFDVDKEKEKSNKDKTRSSSRYLLLTMCVLFSSLLGFLVYDPLVDLAINSTFQINPGSIFKWAWSYNPIPLYGDFYMFNLENPEEFLNGARPELKEVGPFSFQCVYIIQNLYDFI